MDRLFEEKVDSLTFPKAIELAKSREGSGHYFDAEPDRRGSVKFEPTDVFNLRSGTSGALRKSSTTTSGGTSVAKKKCNRCGYTNHKEDVCKYKNYKCHSCGESGHLATVCKNKKKSKPTNNFYFVDNPNETLFNLKTDQSCKPLLLTVKVEHIPVQFEVDTGASVSVISKSFWQNVLSHVKLLSTDKCFTDYTGNKFKPIGMLQVNIQYNNDNFKLKLYVVNNGGPPLIGRDWLFEFRLGIAEIKRISNVNTSTNLSDLFLKYTDVFSDSLGYFTKGNISLTVKEGTVPKFFKPRPLPFAIKDKVEKELDRLVDLNVLSPVSFSRWGTPIVPVIKKNGTIRICGDYKVTVNPVLIVEKYPLPRIEELFVKLQGGKEFTKIDLKQAYQQVGVEENSRELLTISTHKGLFSYNRLPFGIASAPAIFQKIMETILQGLDGVVCFLDDVLITGKDKEEHFERIDKVLSRLQESGLRIAKEKCEFFKTKIEYLGYKIDSKGLHTSEDKIEAIVKAPIPTTVSQLKSFLGMVNYYNKFIRNSAMILNPLYELLQKDTKFIWSKACERSFNTIKKIMTSLDVLVHYNPEWDIKLTVDASAYGLGAVLSHVCPSKVERPIAYASRTLSKSEKNYSQIEKEALAIIFGICKFNQYLFARKFILVTDHKPLLSIFSPKKGLPQVAANRMLRWALLLSSYTYDIQYVQSENNNADAFSRLPLESCEPEEEGTSSYINCIFDSLPVLDKILVAKETATDPVLSEVIEFTKKGWPNSVKSGNLRPYFNRRRELSFVENCLMWSYKVVVPNKLQRTVLNELHRSHMGIVKTKSLARSYVWWPTINKEIESLINSCDSCIKNRSNPAKSELKTWEWPEKPWVRLHIDYMGPFHGKMFFVLVDSHSKWLEVVPTNSSTTDVTIGILRNLFARYGLPEIIVSDNATQFCSDKFINFLNKNGITHKTGAPYHPETNGAAENSVKTTKYGLKKMLDASKSKDLNLILNRFLIDYRNTPHCTTGSSPAKLLMGRNLRSRFDILKPDLTVQCKFNSDDVKNYVNCKQKKQICNYKGKKNIVYNEGNTVAVRDYRSDKMSWIKGYIYKKIGRITYLVKIPSIDRIWKRHVNQIVKAAEASLCNSINNSSPEAAAIIVDSKDKDDLQVAIVDSKDKDDLQSNIFNNESNGNNGTSWVVAGSETADIKSNRPKRQVKPPDRLNYDKL